MPRYYWEWQDIYLKHFSPSEFEYPEKMDPSTLLLLDGLRERCGFPIRVNDDYRTEADMAALYGRDRTNWPNSPHQRGCAVDIEPAGDLPFHVYHRRKMSIMYHALSMWQEGTWNLLGLELGTHHIHVDNDTETRRPYAWPGVSK